MFIKFLLFRGCVDVGPPRSPQKTAGCLGRGRLAMVGKGRTPTYPFPATARKFIALSQLKKPFLVFLTQNSYRDTLSGTHGMLFRWRRNRRLVAWTARETRWSPVVHVESFLFETACGRCVWIPKRSCVRWERVVARKRL